MNTTKLSAKGQVVLPKHAPKAKIKASRVAELAGMLKRNGRKRVSLRTMAAAIESEILARRARGRY